MPYIPLSDWQDATEQVSFSIQNPPRTIRNHVTDKAAIAYSLEQTCFVLYDWYTGGDDCSDITVYGVYGMSQVPSDPQDWEFAIPDILWDGEFATVYYRLGDKAAITIEPTLAGIERLAEHYHDWSEVDFAQDLLHDWLSATGYSVMPANECGLGQSTSLFIAEIELDDDGESLVVSTSGWTSIDTYQTRGEFSTCWKDGKTSQMTLWTAEPIGELDNPRR